MLGIELNEDNGIVTLSPDGPLDTDDMQRLKDTVDPYIDEAGWLNGILVVAEDFPGWDSFAGFMAHVELIHDHHREIRKVAAVSDDGFLSIAPEIMDCFVAAEVRHFAADEKDAAMNWLLEPPAPDADQH